MPGRLSGHPSRCGRSERFGPNLVARRHRARRRVGWSRCGRRHGWRPHRQQRRWRDAPATRRGWDVGTLSSPGIGPDRLATFRYRITVPGSILFPTVKVALAWDSAVTSSGDTPTASTLTVDGVEFAATRGETYEIFIRRWSGKDSVWYGVAWTVTGLASFESVNLANLESGIRLA
jgi:hypothetical protein